MSNDTTPLHKVYLIEVPELHKAYVGRTSYSTVHQRIRQHLRPLMGLPLLTRGDLEERILVSVSSLHKGREAAQMGEQHLLSQMKLRRGLEVINVRAADALVRTKREMTAGEIKEREMMDADDPQPVRPKRDPEWTRQGPVNDVLVRPRERRRLETERQLVQALLPVGSKLTGKELTDMTKINRNDINRAIAQSDVLQKDADGNVSLKREPTALSTDALRTLFDRDTRSAAGTDARAFEDAQDRPQTSEEIAAERERLLQRDDPSRLRTDNCKGKAEKLYALVFNARTDLQAMHTDPVKFAELGSKRFAGDADEARHQMGIWKKSLDDGMIELRAHGKLQRLSEINAYIRRANAVVDAVTQDRWLDVQSRLIMEEMAAPAEGVYYTVPDHDPDF
jgi:hypothetical protein